MKKTNKPYRKKTIQACPCGTGKTYLDCCGRFISQQELPSTPEELMRSRYTAFTQKNMDYLILTMKSPAADHFDANATQEWIKNIEWTGLQIVNTTHDANKGIVEFMAYYHVGDKNHVLHEVSQFSRDNGKWYYVNGIHPNQNQIAGSIEKIGRNALCPCGSGKKYKKCCGAS